MCVILMLDAADLIMITIKDLFLSEVMKLNEECLSEICELLKVIM